MLSLPQPKLFWQKIDALNVADLQCGRCLQTLKNSNDNEAAARLE
jgi:hypothetical protein